MELKEIEEIKQILIKELGQDNCNYLQYNGRLTHLIGLVQAYGQSQYNQALEDLENRHVDYQLVGHTYITVNTKTIQ